MRAKERLCWAVTGGAWLGIIIGLCISPLTAQRDIFGEITCTGQRVVDSEGNQRVSLMASPEGGLVAVCDSNGNPGTMLVGFEGGGKIFVMGQGREEHVTIGVDENGGQIVVHHKDGKSRVTMWSAKDGGQLVVYGKDGKPRGDIGVNAYGNGEISTWRKNGNRLAILK